MIGLEGCAHIIAWCVYGVGKCEFPPDGRDWTCRTASTMPRVLIIC